MAMVHCVDAHYVERLAPTAGAFLIRGAQLGRLGRAKHAGRLPNLDQRLKKYQELVRRNSQIGEICFFPQQLDAFH